MADSEDDFAGFEDLPNSDSESGDASDDEDELHPLENRWLYQVTEEEPGDDDLSQSSENYHPDWRSPKFPRFPELPYELRHRIWEFFCPEVWFKTRLIDVSLDTTARFSEAEGRVWVVREGRTLSDYTKTTRAMLAVHHESRVKVLKMLPDYLSLDAGSRGDGLVRFNKETDLVLLHGLAASSRPNDRFHLPDFSSKIQHVAFSSLEMFADAEALSTLLTSLPNVQSVFCNLSDNPFKRRKLMWCISEYTNRAYVETQARSFGYGEDAQTLYCWPDVRNHMAFAKVHVPKTLCENAGDPLLMVLELKGLRAWPLISFDFESGLERYSSILAREAGEDVESSNDSGSEGEEGPGGFFESESDEYESEGIDDDEIEEDSDSSEEEEALLTDEEPVPEVARFSSPEAEPEADDTDAGPAMRGRKRHIVSDSEDEEEEQGQRTVKRARVALSDSDSDAGPSQSNSVSRGRPSRVVLSDSDDEDGDVHTESKTAKVSKQDAAESDEDEESEDDKADSEEDDDSSEEEEDAPKTLSLAERLRQHRETNPLSASEGSDGEDEDLDDEDEDDDNSILDEDPEAGFLDDMCEERDDDDEDEDEDDDESGFY